VGFEGEGVAEGEALGDAETVPAGEEVTEGDADLDGEEVTEAAGETEAGATLLVAEGDGVDAGTRDGRTTMDAEILSGKKKKKRQRLKEFHKTLAQLRRLTWSDLIDGPHHGSSQACSLCQIQLGSPRRWVVIWGSPVK
jgi:hypothetical protein